MHALGISLPLQLGCCSRATIYESLCLLGWLEAEGVEQRGICGLSMGGVHASMTAGLYPRPLAITPLLTPRSAAVAYCDGALAPLMAWRALLQEKDVADNEVILRLDRCRCM
jgi:pimeloyl-ACP methyl ester carboxylesterase